MNERLDLTIILKDCPKGTEFYSRCLGIVKFESIDDTLKRIIVKNQREVVSYKENGVYYYADEDAEIDLFPSKDQRDWSKWHRPFKDGDILSYQNKSYKNRTIYIYKYHSKMNTSYYVALSGCSDSHFLINDGKYDSLDDYNDTARFATEKEKQRLFDAIELNGYKWNEETKNLDKLVTIFKIGDKIKLKNEYTQKYNDFNIREITEIKHSHYILDDEQAMPLSNQYLYELVTNESYPKSLKHFDNMTREEEIKEASINYTRKNRLNVFAEDKYSEVMREYDRNKAFEEGAKWADKTMIDKACNWLKDRISIPYEGNYNEDGEQPIASDYINFAIERFKIAEEFCKDFIKAMEE